jgi:hypothetical protein
MPAHPSESIGKRLERKRWRQGAILRPDTVKRLVQGVSKGDILIVITQSCDLVHHILEEEPWVELIRARRITKSDGNNEYLKNPRKLHLTDSILGVLEILAHDRYRIPREALKNATPNGFLQDEPLHDSLQHFLARRYRRAAFATEFNDRKDGRIRHTGEDEKTSEKRAEKIYTTLKNLKKDLHMILVMGNQIEQELEPWQQNPTPENTYHLSLVGVLEKGANERELEDTMTKLIRLLNECPGIQIKEQEPDLRTQSELDYETYNKAIRWDADAISARAGQPIPDDD